MKGDAIVTSEQIQPRPPILSRNAGKTLGSAGTKARIGHKQNVNFEPKGICYKSYTKGVALAAEPSFGVWADFI
jgi:hypothetical protein